jgi:hypothetical protein
MRRRTEESAQCLRRVGEFAVDFGDGLAASQECVEHIRIELRAAAFFHDIETATQFERGLVGAFAAERVEDVGN